MRRFLYLSPYFPPVTRVGALRPLKLARHLPAFGWAPVVLADLPPTEPTDPELLAFVPESTVVIRDYSADAAPTAAAAGLGPGPSQRWAPRARVVDYLRRKWRSDDRAPLGHHRLDVGHALRAARRALAAHPGCAAIVTNADPFATLVVGARLARETGLPLIHDLRDPWAPCSLRRPLRPKLQRRWIDRLERRAFAPADAVVLNTETARADYRAHYSDLDPGRFSVIRNHGDPELIRHGRFEGFDRFTALFMGNFRRFLTGEPLIRALARVETMTQADFQLVVTGRVPDEVRRLAQDLGVTHRLVSRGFVPHPRTGPLMAAADLLVAVGHRSPQRIPAKIYEYAQTDRPILAIGDNPELAELLRSLGGARMVDLDDVEGIAAALTAAIAAGRGRRVARAPGFDSRSAAERLAQLLDRVTAPGPSRGSS
jgi:glycosyltransferase involved in cell wall biosynthesis